MIKQLVKDDVMQLKAMAEKLSRNQLFAKLHYESIKQLSEIKCV